MLLLGNGIISLFFLLKTIKNPSKLAYFMKKVVVCSKNPVKLQAVKLAFELMFPEEEFSFKTHDSNSNVSKQPIGDEQTFQGAYNRIIHSREEHPNTDFYAAIEGGVDDNGKEMSAYAWIVIMSEEKIGKAKTATYYLPNKIADLVRQGHELGKADDIVFNQNNSKQNQGSVGLLTDNAITRTSYYVPAVMLALIPFKKVELY